MMFSLDFITWMQKHELLQQNNVNATNKVCPTQTCDNSCIGFSKKQPHKNTPDSFPWLFASWITEFEYILIYGNWGTQKKEK